MATAPVDWTAIRADYEQHGISQKSLALKHSISQQAISKRARKEGWITPLVVSPTISVVPQQPDNDTNADLAIVEKALRQLSGFLDNDGLINLREHKLFADALSQYIKLKLTIPTATQDGQQQQQETPYDMREFLASCTNDELAVIRPILAAVAARKQENETNIRPIRKIG